MPTRRTVLTGAAAGAAVVGLGALPFLINGRTERMSASEARNRGVPLRAFSDEEAATLERLGEVLLPGAADAGIVHFIDSQVSVPAPESLLLLRYLEVPPPYADFYHGGIAALEAHSRASRNNAFADLPAAHARELVSEIVGRQPAAWTGPPSQLFYFAARSDAVDVVYGTMEGFKRLGIPYMAHIEPDKPW